MNETEAKPNTPRYSFGYDDILVKMSGAPNLELKEKKDARLKIEKLQYRIKCFLIIVSVLIWTAIAMAASPTGVIILCALTLAVIMMYTAYHP